MPKITVEKFLRLNEERNNFLKVKCLTGSIGLTNEIIGSEVNRPGMALFGYFKDFVFERIQIFGKGEGNYVLTLAEEKKSIYLKNYLNIKCLYAYSPTI